MVEKWTPMKALGKANRAIDELMVPPFKTDLSEQPNLEFSNLMNADAKTLEEFLTLYGGYKAYLESIARSFGYFFGKEKKVRVNTISQSPTITTAGKGIKGLETFLNYAEKMSPLGNAKAEDCANYIVSLFSDYTKKVSLQNLFHDGGFSNVGISQDMIDLLED